MESLPQNRRGRPGAQILPVPRPARRRRDGSSPPAPNLPPPCATNVSGARFRRSFPRGPPVPPWRRSRAANPPHRLRPARTETTASTPSPEEAREPQEPPAAPPAPELPPPHPLPPPQPRCPSPEQRASLPPEPPRRGFLPHRHGSRSRSRFRLRRRTLRINLQQQTRQLAFGDLRHFRPAPTTRPSAAESAVGQQAQCRPNRVAPGRPRRFIGKLHHEPQPGIGSKLQAARRMPGHRAGAAAIHRRPRSALPPETASAPLHGGQWPACTGWRHPPSSVLLRCPCPPAAAPQSAAARNARSSTAAGPTWKAATHCAAA